MDGTTTAKPSLDTVLAAAIRLCQYKPRNLSKITTSHEESCYSSLVISEASKIPESEPRSVLTKIVFTGDRPKPGQRDIMLRQYITKIYHGYRKVDSLHLKDVYEYYKKEGSLCTSAITMCASVLHYYRLEPPSGLEVEDLVLVMDKLCELQPGYSTPKAWEQDDDGNPVRPTELV